MNLAYECLERNVKRIPNRTAVINGVTGDIYTYAQLNEKVNALANALQELGIKKGDRVAVYLPNIPEFIIAVMANSKGGAITVPFNIMFKKMEIEYIVNNSGCKLVFAWAEPAAENIFPIMDKLPGLEKIVLVERTPDIEKNEKLLKYGIDSPYILFVGSLQPRKNIEGLLKAFATDVAAKDPELKMVIAGPDGWLSGGIEKVCREYPILKEKVIFTGHVNPKELRMLYRNSRAVTYIPFYEGFGLPVLEAMACGTPVVTSNVTSLPEVGGDAVRLVDPNNIDAIGDAICDVETNDALRDRMVKRGLKQAEKFTWGKTSKDTFRVFEEVVFGG